MKRLKQKYENLLYSYEPGAFLPVFRDGELENRREFVRYKLQCFMDRRIA